MTRCGARLSISVLMMLAWRNLWRHTHRTLLTAATVWLHVLATALAAASQSLNLPRFVYAIDWGMFWFLTRPVFLILQFLYQHIGNFGVAILLLTMFALVLDQAVSVAERRLLVGRPSQAGDADRAL